MSVIIPAFDAERYLGAAIASVLAQTHTVSEIVVVDDGSTDATAAVAEAFGEPVRVVRQPWAGANPARNRGVRESTGDWITFLDADDLWEPRKLELQLAAVGADPGIELVFGMVTQFRSPELAADLVGDPGDPARPMVGHHLGAMLVRRTTFLEIGWLDESNYAGDFVDWFARALDQGRRITVVGEVVMRRRLHLHNKGRTAGAGPAEYARALRKVLDRRGRSSG